MKLENKKIILYLIVIAILFFVPIYIIIVNTDTLSDGNEYLFKVKTFDPYDMFRGNYLNIDFMEDRVHKSFFCDDMTRNDICYVTISEDEDGFAYFDTISDKKPANTKDYYKTNIRYSSYDYTYIIKTPTRYYMNENKSLTAEEIYRENTEKTYVKVRVKNGKMVIVGVYVDDVLIDTIEK